MFNIFKKKKYVDIYSPINGILLKIEDVPDPVFSRKMVGDGVALEPTEGIVYSPVNGTLIQLFPTKHALGIKTEEGLEILIHIGMDTVEMKGNGFESFVSEGEKVKIGNKLLKFDMELVKKEHPLTSPIIITNMDIVDKIVKESYGEEVKAGKTKIMRVYLK
ncbi:MAG: PTS system, glucose subfamily, IIA subunit [Caldanaerobacter subterraneus]|jgi:PTS system glucose-specific IIA component|uniref:PTS system, glucose subfamily, IIA subunit n=2 Tax=Thermoanaerobacter TaxID=1754 RepID=B0KCA4_THEP3|nr:MULTISPECIES: PTS glucose transporter subunit IIA [Thermoanaerobacter]KUJ90975.1 MAG: PTS system, glucose subfamily, IIA subunit [Thermoanaerobacter thermocopriae]KUK34675.1 MAG: PTS system, glucose subfamily, IIA subunit [Caldanaerobacter subterraneus]ABY91723.1 PTS system, glucose subfamily, IIA subunit [Thermoanaerobacter sp. X514]ABY95458.1 PTS system, glucose subfamily, IIA subunit [Thermoanaerobacter pseudethanolicus ATCC 33223]ADV80402.1 PTS system, glucose subfamily, IIA subunit [Th